MTLPTLSSSTLVVAFLALAATDAFMPSAISRSATSTSLATPSFAAATVARPITLLFAEGAAEEAAEGAEVPPAAEVAAEEEETPAPEAVAAPEEPVEDPEVTAIKTEIADLEKALKEKKSQINYLEDAADLNSKAGYARKVAEMENMRRTRSTMASSNKETSIANVLRDFMVVKDKLEALKEQYGEDEFGQKYTGLAGSFNMAFETMGCKEYSAGVGDKADRTQVLVVDEEYSTEIDKGCIIKPLKAGLELKGNIIRLAECVASMGEEGEDAVGEEKEAAAEDEPVDL